MTIKWRKVKALPPDKWMPLVAAFHAVRAALGSDDLAARQMTELLRAGTLTAGALVPQREGKGLCLVFTRMFWQESSIGYPPAVCTEHGPAGNWYTFVRRAELDRMYARAAQVEIEEEPLLRRRPGRKPRGDWPKMVGAWLVVILDDALDADENKRTAVREKLRNINALIKDARFFLRQQIGWAPEDDGDLRREIRHYLRFLNF
jgi:hypothetical protein